MRIRFIKQWKGYRVGQVVKLAADKATELIKRGLAIKSKDMVKDDYETK